MEEKKESDPPLDHCDFWDSFDEEDYGIFCDVNLMYDSHFYIGTGIQWYKNSTALLMAFDE